MEFIYILGIYGNLFQLKGEEESSALFCLQIELGVN